MLVNPSVEETLALSASPPPRGRRHAGTRPRHAEGFSLRRRVARTATSARSASVSTVEETPSADDPAAADPHVADVAARAGPDEMGEQIARVARRARTRDPACRRARGPRADRPRAVPGPGGRPRPRRRRSPATPPRPPSPPSPSRRRAAPAGGQPEVGEQVERVVGRRTVGAHADPDPRGRASPAAARSRWPASRCWPGSGRPRRRAPATGRGRRRPCARSARPAPGRRGRRSPASSAGTDIPCSARRPGVLGTVSATCRWSRSPCSRAGGRGVAQHLQRHRVRRVRPDAVLDASRLAERRRPGRRRPASCSSSGGMPGSGSSGRRR